MTICRNVWTNHFSGVKARSPPGGCVCSTTVETPSAYPVVQLCRRVICIYGVELMLPRIVVSKIVSPARDLGRNNVYCRGVRCRPSISVVRRNIARLSSWLNTIRRLCEPCRWLVKCTWAIRLCACIANVAIVRGGEVDALSGTASGRGW